MMELEQNRQLEKNDSASITLAAKVPLKPSGALVEQTNVSQVLSTSCVSSLSVLSTKTTEERQAEFKAATQQIRKQLAHMRRGTLDPHSKFLKLWDVVTMLALTFTIFVTPFEVAFLALYHGPMNFVHFSSRTIIRCCAHKHLYAGSNAHLRKLSQPVSGFESLGGLHLHRGHDAYLRGPLQS